MKRKIVLIPLALLLATSILAMGCPPEEVDPVPVVPDTVVFEWRMQSTWPAGFFYHYWAKELAESIEKLSGGRLVIEVLPAGTIVGAFDVLDAVHDGVLDMGHSWVAYWAGREPAAMLFASAPGGPFGMDNLDFVTWLYHGGGFELLQEMFVDEMGMNIKSFPVNVLPPEPFGWFERPMRSLADLEGVKMREVGLTAAVYREMGIGVIMLPGGEIVSAMELGTIDAAAFTCPTADMGLGLMDVAKYYHAPGMHRPTGTLELLINKDRWNELPADLQAIVKVATKESLLHSWMLNLYANVGDMETLKDVYGVTLVDTPDEVLGKILEVWDQVAAEYAAECAFFARVLQSQKNFAGEVVPFRLGFWAPYEFAARHYWPEE